MSSSAGIAQKSVRGVQGWTVMQQLPRKLARRAALAQRQDQRRGRARKEAERRAEASELRREGQRKREQAGEAVRNERRWRREDWVLGPLAPKRDAGHAAASFGALDVAQVFGAGKVEPRTEDYGIVVGDRVVIVKRGHPEQGRIGRVKEVREKSEEVILDKMNVVEVAVPKFMLLKETDKTPVRPYERPLHLSEVRLVAPLRDPATGSLKDVVINQVALEKITRREKKGIDPPTRYVAGLDPPQIIAYPERRDADEEEHDADTLRIQVDERTWMPTVRMPPMPPQVLDELRNKFSRFRIRHDGDYLARVEREEAARDAKKRQARLMMTPLKERRLRERLERRALGVPQLSDESLARIGDVMERNLASKAAAAVAAAAGDGGAAGNVPVPPLPPSTGASSTSTPEMRA